jgi:hypothetical protein
LKIYSRKIDGPEVLDALAPRLDGGSEFLMDGDGSQTPYNQWKMAYYLETSKSGWYFGVGIVDYGDPDEEESKDGYPVELAVVVEDPEATDLRIVADLLISTYESDNSFTSAALDGFVAGENNTISSPGASVSGGTVNTASGSFASVSGGLGSTASGSFASVSGGESNKATHEGASVSGGETNTASSFTASVSGGEANTADGTRGSSVSGGFRNTASGNFANVIGGQNNTANTNFSIRPQPPFL